MMLANRDGKTGQAGGKRNTILSTNQAQKNIPYLFGDRIANDIENYFL
jgi:hypothetical protein